MTSPLDRPFIYSEIVTHTTLELMTKLTEYPYPAKQDAKIEAQRSNAEAKVMRKYKWRGRWRYHENPLLVNIAINERPILTSIKKAKDGNQPLLDFELNGTFYYFQGLK